MSTNPNTKYILITGGTDGIGLELVKAYGQQGHQILVVGRRAQPYLPDNPNIHYLCQDVGAKGASDAIIDEINRLGWQQLDIAILNAAMATISTPGAHSDDEIDATLNVNTISALHLAHALYPLLEKAHGRLAFIGSMAVKAKTPTYPLYTASKAALAGAARSLYLEWQDQVRVCLIHPGPTATNMHDKAGMDVGKTKPFFTAPRTVANSIINAIELKKRVTFLGLPYMLFHALKQKLGAR